MPRKPRVKTRYDAEARPGKPMLWSLTPTFLDVDANDLADNLYVLWRPLGMWGHSHMPAARDLQPRCPVSARRFSFRQTHRVSGRVGSWRLEVGSVAYPVSWVYFSILVESL